MTANVNVTKVLFKRGNTAQNAAYTGINGEITVDTQAKTLRVHDGVTTGGNIVTAGAIASYLPTDPTITSIQANVAAANAAISAIAGIDTSLLANAATQQTQIDLINANVAAANALIPNLLAVSGNIIPAANITYSLGSEQFQWRDLWVSNNTIYIGNTPIRVDGDTLLVNNSPVASAADIDMYSNANVASYLPTYSGNISANISKAGYTWTFGTTGNMTTAGPVVFPNTGELRPSSTAYDAALAAWEVIRGGEIQAAIDAEVVTEEGWPMVNWHPTNTTAQGYIDFLLTAWNIQQDLESPPLIITPAISSAFYQAMRNSLISIRDSYNNTNSGVSIAAGYANVWHFGNTGSLSLPTNGDINFKGGDIIQSPSNNLKIVVQDPNSDFNSLDLVVDDGSENVQTRVLLDREAIRFNVDLQGNNYAWTFGNSGNISFPDSTVQTTAWTGTVNFGNTIAIGYNTGTVSQGAGAVAIGSTAGNSSQGIGAVAVGNRSGVTSQSTLTVAVGSQAGEISQGIQATAVGSGAGNYNQSAGTVAIGTNAGAAYQGLRAVAVGSLAGSLNQGEYAVALGNFAGGTDQANNSIIINATGSSLDQTTPNTFTVKPIRSASTGNVLYYNTSSGEITYEAGSFVYGNTEVQAYLQELSSINFTASPASISGVQNMVMNTANVTSSLIAGSITATSNITQQSAYYETYANVTNSGGNLTCNFVNGATFYATLTANVTVNFANVVATAGQVTGATLIVDQGATAYSVANIQINSGGVQTVKWAGGTTNTGTASNTDIMSFSLISLDGTNWRILGQIANYA